MQLKHNENIYDKEANLINKQANIDNRYTFNAYGLIYCQKIQL